jgi:iron(III) transport system ATP-binding protein
MNWSHALKPQFLSSEQAGRRVGLSGYMKRRATASFPASVQIEHAWRRFGDLVAVRDVSLDIAPGEIICLLGPSGCGKTTLLRIVCGLEAPDSGRVLIDGREMSGPGTFVQPEARGVGLMFQDFALFPHMSILENVAFGLQAMERKTALAEARVALERMGLAAYAEAYPHMLSGGQQQRVALARAVVPRPRVMMMDEPFSGLDPRLRASMREETLAILRETRTTCIIVTHEAEEAMLLGDRIAIMRGGEIVQVGTTQEIFDQPSELFVAEMMSEINVVPCKVSGGAARCALGTFPTAASVAGDSLMCFRPRVIQISETEDAAPAQVMGTRSLGDETIVELAVEGVDTPLLMRLSGAFEAAPGTWIGIAVPPDKVHVFPACNQVRASVDR